MSSFEAKWKGTAEGAKSILGVARELMLVVTARAVAFEQNGNQRRGCAMHRLMSHSSATPSHRRLEMKY